MQKTLPLLTLLLGALLAAPLHAEQPAAEAAVPESAALLAPEYRDPALRQRFSAFQNAAVSLDAIRQFNAQMRAAAANDPVQPSGKITAPERRANGYRQPAVDIYLFRPKTPIAGNAPVIYFIHGGGYLLGHARMQNAALADLAERSRAVVASVEYRLAVDAPFPADVRDAYHGLSYLFDHAAELGFDPEKIVIMGESAGGGLAARLALLTRDMGRYHPAGQVLIYPMLDYRTGTAQSPYRNPYAGEFVWTPGLNRLGWRTLRGGQTISAGMMPYYSAATAKNLARLPRTFIITGSLDLFANEDIDYANRLIQAGVPTDLLVIDGVYHAFESANPGSPQTRRYLDARTDAIRRMFGDAAAR